jgi:stress response protein YsnF
VRLGKQAVTEQEQVTEQVRQERIEVEDEDQVRHRDQR